MSLVIGFGVFIGAMVLCISLDYTMVIALFIGLAAFAAIGTKKGYTVRALTGMGVRGVKDAFVVVKIMCIIGFITAAWRSSGTIAFFVYYGIKLITPDLFLIVTFILSCLLSYALGTSFGVAGTVGVIFITLARSGGVSEIVTAGAVMSGIYFGDRGSPVSCQRYTGIHYHRDRYSLQCKNDDADRNRTFAPFFLYIWGSFLSQPYTYGGSGLSLPLRRGISHILVVRSSCGLHAASASFERSGHLVDGDQYWSRRAGQPLRSAYGACISDKIVDFRI